MIDDERIFGLSPNTDIAAFFTPLFSLERHVEGTCASSFMLAGKHPAFVVGASVSLVPDRYRSGDCAAEHFGLMYVELDEGHGASAEYFVDAFTKRYGNPTREDHAGDQAWHWRITDDRAIEVADGRGTPPVKRSVFVNIAQRSPLPRDDAR